MQKPGTRVDGRDLLLDCIIQPGARQTEIVGWHGDRLRIRIHAPPIDGKANAELQRFVAACCQLPRSRVTVEHGATSRRKTLRLHALSALPDCFPRNTSSADTAPHPPRL